MGKQVGIDSRLPVSVQSRGSATVPFLFLVAFQVEQIDKQWKLFSEIWNS